MNPKARVLFVCVHNSGRSRMAEAWLRELGGEGFDVVSAGFESHATLPLVVEALEQVGLRLATPGPQSSVFELYKAGRFFDHVIRVCDEEQGQRCPLFPRVREHLSWSFPDPRTFTGSREEQLARIIELRDVIKERVEKWLETLPG